MLSDLRSDSPRHFWPADFLGTKPNPMWRLAPQWTTTMFVVFEGIELPNKKRVKLFFEVFFKANFSQERTCLESPEVLRFVHGMMFCPDCRCEKEQTPESWQETPLAL